MENNNDILKEKFKFRIAISKMKNEEKEEKINVFYGKKFVVAACACFVFTTGIVFAKDIKEFAIKKFASGDAIAEAAENGYIGNSNEVFKTSKVEVKKGESSETADTFNVDIKTKDFLIDDRQISIEYELKFDKKINNYKNLNQRVVGNEEYIDYENFGDLLFSTAFILDEENRLIYSSATEEEFNSFCKEHNLNYTYNEYNENYLRTGGSPLITEINVEENSINLNYNYKTADEIFKSKKLYIYINKMVFIPKGELNDRSNRVTLLGNWEFELDVPEIMYNRQNIDYEVINCDNDRFEVYEAKLTNTGFDIGIIVSDVICPKYPEELSKKESEHREAHPDHYSMSSKEEFIEIYGEDPKYEKLYLKYQKESTPINASGRRLLNWVDPTCGCYILNSKGEKYMPSKVASFKSMETGFKDDNKYNYYDNFDLLPSNATDKITVVIDFYGEPVHIELKRK